MNTYKHLLLTLREKQQIETSEKMKCQQKGRELNKSITCEQVRINSKHRT